MKNIQYLMMIALFVLINLTACSKRAALPPDVMLREVDKYMIILEASVDSMGDVGYAKYTPEETIKYLITANKALPGEPQGIIEVVTGTPTKSWQIVLTPLPQENKIKIEAYGEDTTTPIQTKTVKVP